MIEGVPHDSPTWRALRRHLDQRITVLQRLLEGDQPENWTAKNRGAIAELRSLIEDVEPRERPTETKESDPALY